MNPIAIFYHCLFFLGDATKPLESARLIVPEQMDVLKTTGLLDTASHFLVGVNGGSESEASVKEFIPAKAECVYHGLRSRNENLTVVELEKWLPGHDDWYVLYFHAKGATHPVVDPFSSIWRRCMMRHNLLNWKQCVADLDAGYEAVGCHWMEPPNTPKGQYIFAGTFWWAKAGFLLTLPSIMDRDRIKVSGIESLESRYEAEVILGNGPRPPRIKDYHPNWNPSRIATCLA